MAEKRRNKKRIQEEPEKPTKEEYAVASFLRFNVPCKEAKLMSLPVQCFVASKAIDAMLDSKWATNRRKTEALFTTRSSCVDYCNRLLSKGIFHRAYRPEKSKTAKKKPKKEEASDKKEEKTDKTKEKKGKKKEEKKEECKDTKDDKGKDSKEDKKSDEDSEKKVEKKDEEKKKKRKMKLEMHDVQKFVDGNDEIFVWIYDPVPLKNKIIGLFLVLGAIGVCLFPLWPPEVRLGVYYLSLLACFFVGFILALCVIRVIVFGLVWGVTFGKHHLWIFPNLTEDVGIIDSFKPFYHHSVAGDEEKKSDDKNREDSDKKESSIDDKQSLKEAREADEELAKSNNGEEEKSGEQKDGSGTEGESTQDESNGYEIVGHDDVDKEGTEE